FVVHEFRLLLEAGALMIFSAVFLWQLEQLAMLAARHRVPASYQFREFVSAGGLMSYGINRIRLVSTPGVFSRVPRRPTSPPCRRLASSSSSISRLRRRWH